MNSSKFKAKVNCKKWIKYFIFNFILFGAFFAVQLNGGENAKAADFEFVVNNSNYSGKGKDGNATSKDAVKTNRYDTGADPDYLFEYSVQGTGVTMKDVVSVTMKKSYSTEIRSIVAFESGFTTSGNRNYDVYRKDDTDNNWQSLSEHNGTDYEIRPGVVVTGACDTVFLATDARLKANGGDYYSLICIADNGSNLLTIQYAYTIRNEGYGIKDIAFGFYNDVPTPDAMVASAENVELIVSKPLSQFSFSLISSSDETTDDGKCHTSADASATGSPVTDNICVKYINGTAGNTEKPMEIVIPKEAAYTHGVGVEGTPVSPTSVIDNTIYGINTFQNNGSSNYVKYYYYDFKLYGASYGVAGNVELDPFFPYKIYFMVDAMGDYEIRIIDIFNNYFSTKTSTGGVDIPVEDVSITDVIVDYTNEDILTLMSVDKADYSTSGDWKTAWEFTLKTDVDFKKLKKDSVKIEIHVFQRVVINNGVFAGGAGLEGATGIEDIAKAPLGNNENPNPTDKVNSFKKENVVVWRVIDVANDNSLSTNGVSCGTDAVNLCISPNDFAYTAPSADKMYGVSTVKNKIEFTIKSNGKYRISLTDRFNNTTNNDAALEKNPSVEVTVIDRTTPVISSLLTGNTASAAETSITTYPYVIGGGQENVVMPSTSPLPENYWQTASNYETIYYNSKGSKYFDYEDALEIAKIKIVDSVMYYDADDSDFNATHAYNVNYNICTVADFDCNGVYTDPVSGILSDRNTTSETITYEGVSLHNYIINENITSFTGGLVLQAAETAYDSSNSYAVTTGATGKYVNAGTAASFAGYLKITFKNMSDELICTVALTADDNKACFNLMNQYIDDVESFKMIFEAQDYNSTEADRHDSNDYVVSVSVIDDTAPGIDMTGTSPNIIEYTNENSVCRLEIGNNIQSKTSLLNCYKLLVEGNYKFKDNNIDHTESDVTLDAGVQYYSTSSSKTDNVDDEDYYHNKIVLSIYEEGDADFEEVTDSVFPYLNKSGYHQFKFVIYDHWNPDGASDHNSLTVYMTYYVNPRTLIVEPIAVEKMYGEADSDYPFEYCVYVNNDNSTFNLANNFFDKEFINKYFVTIYCTKDIYVDLSVNTTRYVASAGTENKGYDYYVFTENASGEYALVNNTYIKVSGVQKYKLSYESDANGKYYYDGTTEVNGSKYIEIKSGYTYKDDECLYLAKDSTELNYFKTGVGADNCHTLSGHRYKQKYTADSTGTFVRYNNGGTAEAALVEEADNFTGGLTRVESTEYNQNRYTSAVINNNVGQYNIVLGSLNVVNASDANKHKDYLIRINTNYKAPSRGASDPLKYDSGDPQVSSASLEVDDDFKTESTVLFTITQAILTIKSNGSSKVFGSQDPFSNKWETKDTATNSTQNSYLNGYAVEGYRYSDTNASNIVLGVLRRQTGEDVGVYDICNVTANPSAIIKNETTQGDCTSESEQPVFYNTSKPYYFDAYGRYTYSTYGNDSGAILASAAPSGSNYQVGLITKTNAELVTTAGAGYNLNRETRNYAVLYIGTDFTINTTDLIIQPGVNQGKEYAKTEYHDPLWQLVVYGEANFTKSNSANGFNGYTDTIDEESHTPASHGMAPYYSGDSEVYYARRKTSPSDVDYAYVTNINLTTYDKYKLDANGFYYLDASGDYVYAYGKYYPIATAVGNTLKIEVVGKLVNDTYSLFTSEFTAKRANSNSGYVRAVGASVQWYEYVPFDDYDSTNGIYTIKSNELSMCGDGDDPCRNYTVTYNDRAPGATVDVGTNKVTKLTTDMTIDPVEYKPDGINGCFTGDTYSQKCLETQKTKIMFEIFKRDIVIEFIDDNYKFIYGERYHYYHTNIFEITSSNTGTKERDVFLCYSDLGDYLVDCTTNNDYGTTAGDTWDSIGLEFHLHSALSGFARDASGIVSYTPTKYYASGTGAGNKAIPAGQYYVYASIKDTQNYNFVYLGGTLTIKQKTTNVQIAGYTMEYANPYYSTYGLGSSYTDYSVFGDACMVDSNFTSNIDALISTCTEVRNVVGNTYGFVIEGLDSTDTIAQNFKGRPQREANRENNKGKYLDVGYYYIGIGTIGTIKDTVNANFKACADSVEGKESENCIVVDTYTTNGINYDIQYSLTNNEGAYLFVMPANLTITVKPEQTKMYGCAYDEYHVLSETGKYTYTFNNGYADCDGTYDLSYKYNVAGDKDNATTHGQSINYDVINASGTLSYSDIVGTGTRNHEIFNGRNLYRVDYAETISYTEAKADSAANKYQKQSVGTYTISIGDLNAMNNINASMCDAYNNPVLEGGSQCRNYNINYYGESAIDHNASHSYNDKKAGVTKDNLVLYTLNYVAETADNPGEYVLIDGKYVDLNKLPKYSSVGATTPAANGAYVLISNYVDVDTLTTYDKFIQYEKDNAGTYVYVDGAYKLISTLTKYAKKADGSGYEENNSVADNAAYLLINGNYIKFESLTRFKQNYDPSGVGYTEANQYTAHDSVGGSKGKYVLINDKYVQLSSLKRYTYSESTKLYTADEAGTYVQIYKYMEIANLTKYNLAVSEVNMYNQNAAADTTKNIFAFVNGSFVPYISVDTDNVYDANFKTDITDSANQDVKFVITARIVYVHPEYNVKPYQEDDVNEYITCAEIKNAYGLADFTGRTSYCADANAQVVLGKSMYYAVENSLARYPWTAWVDSRLNGVPETDGAKQKYYNDLQYDVVTGQVSRAEGENAGKYTYDFANVTTNDSINGNNYMIQYVVKGNHSVTYNYDNTYVRTAESTYAKLSTLIYEACKPGEAHCVITPDVSGAVADGGKKIKDGRYELKVDNNGIVSASGTAKSISLIPKFASQAINDRMDYWYLGFYIEDGNDGRNGEIAKWWTNRDSFSTPYGVNGLNCPDSSGNWNCFRYKNASAAPIVDNGTETGYNYFTSAAREVYFEIIKRTIYLYAVDAEKTYGEADKYSDLMVAICPNNLGYKINNSGGIECYSEEASSGYGLGASDKEKFVTDGVMNQWKIKHYDTDYTNDHYIFNGVSLYQESFGIYFRRSAGEDAGSYRLTACALQTGVSDCTHRPTVSNPDYTIVHTGDNYNIIEIPGVLTINTRSLDLTPDAGQGFEYGNYTENGSLPQITFKETHTNTNSEEVNGLINGNLLWAIGNTVATKYAITKTTSTLYSVTIESNTYTIDGLDVIDANNAHVGKVVVSTSNGRNTKKLQINIGGTTSEYTIIQAARCLIDISGLSTICINDGQNEALADVFGLDYDTTANITFVYGATYPAVPESAKTNVAYQSNDVYGDGYSNPANRYTRNEGMTRSALSLECDSESARYSRDVCNYTITSGELDAGSEFNRIEFSDGNGSNPDPYETRVLYVYVTQARRYIRSGSEGSYTYTASPGEYTAATDQFVKFGNGLYAPYDASKLVAYVCDADGTNCRYEKTTDDANTLHDETTDNKYLPITLEDYNYIINSFTEGTFVVDAADIAVTPIEKQYKIYGEADVEMKFTVETTYVITKTQYQEFASSNIVQICRPTGVDTWSCLSGDDELKTYRYNKSGSTYTQNDAGTYILLTKGWKIVLNSYAYNEEVAADNANNLDYGQGYTQTKHTEALYAITPTYGQTGAIHFDKYTKYLASVVTHRILIGNLYVEDHDQTVGEKNILNGMEVTSNGFGEKNYILQAFDPDNLTQFVIIPRPINIQVQNVTKIYGQATDSVSCATGVTPCIVGNGILTADENESKLINNYNILTRDLTTGGIVDGTKDATTGNITKSVVTTTYTDGVEVVYTNDAKNLPTITYSNINSSRIITNLTAANIPTGYTDATAYYTESVGQEVKNTHLNIEVQRENVNIARKSNSDVCMVTGEAFCEDAGEYNLKFNYRGTAETLESTVASAYYGSYWGYNPNYYAIIYNNFVASGWDASEDYNQVTANSDINNLETGETAPTPSATLKIRKRSIQMVVETISEYTYTASLTGKYLLTSGAGTVADPYVYHLITTTNRYNDVSGTYVQSATGTHLFTGSEYVEILDTDLATTNRYNRSSTTVGEKYSIEQNMDVPELLGVNNSAHHTTYEAITWYEQPQQVRLGDELYGRVAYCQHAFDITSTLDDLRKSPCSGADADYKLHYYDSNINVVGQTNFFDTSENGYYVITRETNELYIKNANNPGSIAAGVYEANNYTTEFINGILQIDLDETPPVINVQKDFVMKEANGGLLSGDGTELKFLEALINNYCANITSSREGAGATLVTCKDGSGNDVIFAYDPADPDRAGVGNDDVATVKFNGNIKTVLEWFGISSFDPSIMRAGAAVGKRYDARWYMAIQADFNQKKTGDYSIFLYAQDNAGNISLASIITLRVIDETKPVVGNLNLYSAKVKCKANSDCTQEDNWVVDASSASINGVYLPIHTLAAENLEDGSGNAYFDASKKYAYGAYTNAFTEDNVYGTYYFIPAGTNAKAVKHNGWTNTSTGIYMTVTYDATNNYGADNSLAYLNLAGYTKYKKDGGNVLIENPSSGITGDHILLGSFINISNMTKYIKVTLDTNGDQDASGTTVLWMPDKNGTFIRYKGYYYGLSDGKYYGETGVEATNVPEEYKANIYSYDSTNKKYEPLSGEMDPDKVYVIMDGSLYELPSERYNEDGARNDASGTYINFAQWDHYYSLDNGYTWIKYSRDYLEGQLALGQDGQRLITIKAIDTGFVYANSTIEKTHATAAYCHVNSGGACTDWNKVVTGKATYTENNGAKSTPYNISDWETYNAAGNRDRQYAYLDTILPNVALTDKYIEVYEYGCVDATKCKTNHVELFGNAIDGYYIELSKLQRFDYNGTDYVLNPSGEYVYFKGEHISTTNRITVINTKDYVYLGKTDSLVSMDATVTGKVGDRLFVDLSNGGVEADFVFNKYTNSATKNTVVLKAIYNASEDNRKEKLQANTTYNQSGVGAGDTLFDGVGDANKTFGATITGGVASAADIANKYLQINIYAHVTGGSEGIANTHSFLSRGLGYYKFIIKTDSTDSAKFEVLSCYNGTTAIGEGQWCANAANVITVQGYASIKAAMEDIMAVYKDNSGNNAYDFKGNDVTFTVDYRVFDIAGNASPYVRKGILFTSFTSHIATNNGSEPAAAQTVVEVTQNADIASALSNFNIVTTSGDGLKSGERILQSVYYNGALVSSRQAYDLDMLSTLDTSVPGVYKIVYSVERRDGNSYVQGNSVELLVTIKPNVANVAAGNINYSTIIVAFGGFLAIGLAMLFIELKRKTKN